MKQYQQKQDQSEKADVQSSQKYKQRRHIQKSLSSEQQSYDIVNDDKRQKQQMQIQKQERINSNKVNSFQAGTISPNQNKENSQKNNEDRDDNERENISHHQSQQQYQQLSNSEDLNNNDSKSKSQLKSEIQQQQQPKDHSVVVVDDQQPQAENQALKQAKKQHQNQNENQNENQPQPQQPTPPLMIVASEQEQRKNTHPSLQYSIQQLYSIRKQSITQSNQQVYRRLTKSFYKIKELKAGPNSNTILSKLYDYENNSARKTIRKVRDNFNSCTQANIVVKRKIDKMRSKVDRIRKQVENSEELMIKEVDFNRTYIKSHPSHSAANSASAQKGQGHGQHK